MSTRITNFVKNTLVGDPNAKAVLYMLADQCNDGGTGVWSSTRYLAHLLEKDPRTVQRGIRYLVDNKFITRIPRPGRSNLWKINIPVLVEHPNPWVKAYELPDEDPLTELYETGDSPEQQPTTETTSTPGKMSHTPGKMPPINSTKTNTEPVAVVVYPDGSMVPENKICERCKSAPKAYRAKKYCQECQEAAAAEYELLKQHPAVAAWLDRIDTLPLSGQMEMIAEKVQNLPLWDAYLDKWQMSGWYLGKSGLANVLAAYTDDTYNLLNQVTPTTTAKPISDDDDGWDGQEIFKGSV